MTLTWMAYGTLVSAAIAALAWGVERWVRFAGRPVRFVWIGAMWGIALVLAGVAVRPRTEVPDPGLTELPTVTAAPTMPTVSAVAARDMAGDLWLGGSAVVLLAVLAGVFALGRTRRRGQVATWFGTPVVETDGVGPGAAPFGHPAIFVPAGLRDLPEGRARLLLTHETEHVAAGDARWLLATATLLVAMPWNVPLWWCFRRLRTAIECDCDARVLRRGAALGDYASLLLDLAVPRGRAIAALIPLAHSATQLRTRIDAMTTRPVFTPGRRLSTLLLMALATVAACEARMPAPVAPVSDYVVKDGQASPVVVVGTNRDSLRASLVEGVELSLSSADTSTLPVVVVRDASNAVVYSGRMAARDSLLAGIAPDQIASVEVIKARDVLPAGARGGMIIMRLKPGATWKGVASASGMVERAAVPGAGAVRVRVRGDSGKVLERPSASGGALSVRVRGDSLAVFEAAPGAAPVVRAGPAGSEPTVSLIDAEGKEVWSGRGMGREVEGVSMFGPWRVATGDIARVEVFKGPLAQPGGLITVHLKPGAKPVRQ